MAAEREPAYRPGPDGEYFMRDGKLVIGWEDRSDDQDPDQLRAEFEAYEEHPLVLVPVLTRRASDIECRINGWEEGTFIDCTARAKNPIRRWRIEWADEEDSDHA
jgi:hypothetical protein